MHSIEFSDEELRLLHAALHSYLDDFGHDEALAMSARIANLVERSDTTKADG